MSKSCGATCARLFAAHHNNAIKGMDPSPEMVALFEMFSQEWTPMAVSELCLDRFIAARWHGV